MALQLGHVRLVFDQHSHYLSCPTSWLSHLLAVHLLVPHALQTSKLCPVGDKYVYRLMSHLLAVDLRVPNALQT
jgi:hypothetical protein